MTLPHDHSDDPTRSDPRLQAIVQRLDARGCRLRVRDGLTDRVMAAVSRELDATSVVARIGPLPMRRWAALAAVLAVALAGVVTALMLRGDRSTLHEPTAGETLILAEASPAERLLVAFVDDSVPGAAKERAELMEEILPGSAVQYDELDLELRRILGSTGANGDASR